MIAEQLRKSIIQAAISGQLTEHVPTDAHAEELLEEIRAEKLRRIEVGELKKERPLPPISPKDVPFEIPPGWVWTRLGELAIFVNGDRGKNYAGRSTWVTSGVPFINAGSLNNGVLTDDALHYISRETFERLRSGNVQRGDLLYCLRGSLGKFSVNEHLDEGTIGSSLVIIRPIAALIQQYLGVYFSSTLAADLVRGSVNGSAQPNLSAESVRRFIVPLPPIPVQHRIIRQLDKLIPQVDELSSDEAELEALRKRFPKEMRNAILQDALSGRATEHLPEDTDAREFLEEISAEKARLVAAGALRREKPLPPIAPNDVPFEVPTSWTWARLGDLVLKLTDGTHHSPPNGSEGEYLYLTAKNIRAGEVSLVGATRVSKEIHDAIYSRCNPSFGDVLMVKDGATTGAVALNTLNEPFSMLSSVALMKSAGPSDSRFLAYALMSDFFQRSLKTQMSGTGIPRVTLRKLQLSLVPVPPPATQKRIADHLDELLPLCASFQ